MSATARRRPVRLPLAMWWRIALVAGMIYVLVLTLLDGVAAAGLSWRGGYLAIAAALTPLEAYFSHRMAKRRELRGGELSRFRLAEALVLILAVTAFRFLWQGLPSLGGRLERLFDLEFFLAAGVLLAVWQAAAAMIRWFEQLDFQPGEKPPPVTSPEYDLWVGSRVRHVQHTAAFQHILTTFLAGGVLIMVLAGMARVDPRAIIDFQRGTIRALILHVLFYFLFGLTLTAEARLALLYTRWQHEEATISPAVARRWPALVLGLLAVAVLLALVLPVDYSVGFIDAIAYALNLILTIVVTIAYLVMYLAGMLLYPLRWLMGQSGGEPAPPPPTFQPPEPRPAPAGSPPFLEAIKTLVLWLLALGMAGFALYNFLREHRAALEKVAVLRPLLRALASLAGLLRALFRGVARVGGRVRAGLERRTRGARAAISRRAAGLPRLGRMSPGELVRYYYLSTVRRAEQAGFPRRANQTPDEYGRRLGTVMPDLDEDLGTLTEAFVEVRYSRHPVDQQYARGIRPYWERLRRALRERRTGAQGPPPSAPEEK